MSARTLADAWDEELVAMPLDVTEEQVQALRRAFFRGALAAMGIPPEQLRAELVAHGRSVGTAAEKAQAPAPRIDSRGLALMRRRA